MVQENSIEGGTGEQHSRWYRRTAQEVVQENSMEGGTEGQHRTRTGYLFKNAYISETGFSGVWSKQTILVGYGG